MPPAFLQDFAERFLPEWSAMIAQGLSKKVDSRSIEGPAESDGKCEDDRWMLEEQKTNFWRLMLLD